MALETAPLRECFRDGTSPKVLSLVRPAGTPGRPAGRSPAGPRAHLALAHRALTSLSLMSSQRRSCSICRSRSLISAMAHPPGAGQSRGRRPLRTAQGSPGKSEGEPANQRARAGGGTRFWDRPPLPSRRCRTLGVPAAPAVPRQLPSNPAGPR